MATELIFKQSAVATPGRVRLTFGGGDDDAPPSGPSVTVSGGGTITGLRLRIATRYDINLFRSTVAATACRWQDADQIGIATAGLYQQSARMPVRTDAVWQDAATVRGQHSVRWQDSQHQAVARGHRYEDAQRLPGRALLSRFEQADSLRIATRSAFEEALRLPGAVFTVRFEETYRDRQVRVTSAFEQALRLLAPFASGMGNGVRTPHEFTGRYQQAWTPRIGRWVRPVQPPAGAPCYMPGLPVRLVFAEAGLAGALPPLVFVCERHTGTGPVEPGATVVVPVRRVYIVLNSITLTRVDTGAELRAHAFSLNLDYQSWTWSWSATLHHDAAPHLGRDSAGDPAELEAVVNGVAVRLRLERITEDRRFLPQLRWSVSGKGKASILGAPYAPSQSFGNAADRTAQQLADEALTVNGVGIGWSLDWGIVDWLVPGGAWGLQGRYIDAVNDIVGAAGGYVQPHATDAVLRVLPRYPSAPWEWAGVTPDLEIPGAAAEVVGIEHVDKPEYNRVFVGGVATGVFGPFSRTGTSGNLLAPPVNHALITHADAHRARGIAELSDTGRQEHVSLRMQVLPETGLVMPGQFVRYVGDRTVMGIVRSTSIEWNRPTLRQTIGIETHAD